MVCRRMLALTFQILGSESGDATEHFALATLCSAVNFSGPDVVKKMFFVSMAAKAFGCGTYIFTVYSIPVSPSHIKSIFPGFSDVVLELLEFLL